MHKYVTSERKGRVWREGREFSTQGEDGEDNNWDTERGKREEWNSLDARPRGSPKIERVDEE